MATQSAIQGDSGNSQEGLLEDEQKAAYIQQTVIEITVRLTIVAVLFTYCWQVLQPFATVIVWGGIIAIAFQPVIAKLTALLGGKQKLAATLFTLCLLALILVPAALIVVGSVGQAGTLMEQLEAGTLQVPPPTDSVATWPIIGPKLHAIWLSASDNLEAVFIKYQSEIISVLQWLGGALGGTVSAIFQFAFSVIIAGIFLAKADESADGLQAVATRFSKARGERFIKLAVGTIRSVAQGVVGVAIIQAVAGGLGILAVGIPGAALWSATILLVAIMQLPPLIVLLPLSIYVFSVSSTVVGVLFLIWNIIVSGSDAVLKPLLLGRGVDVPMLVVLLGALGGMVLSGIIGLFVGAVILSLGYSLFVDWLNGDEITA